MKVDVHYSAAQNHEVHRHVAVAPTWCQTRNSPQASPPPHDNRQLELLNQQTPGASTLRQVNKAAC